jgi:hypothetical protein
MGVNLPRLVKNEAIQKFISLTNEKQFPRG